MWITKSMPTQSELCYIKITKNRPTQLKFITFGLHRVGLYGWDIEQWTLCFLQQHIHIFNESCYVEAQDCLKM